MHEARQSQNTVNSESVASLQRIAIDAVSVLCYFSGPKFTKEGDHVGTGRVLG